MKYGINILVSHPKSPSVAEQLAIYARCGFDACFLGSKIQEPYEKLPEWSALAARLGISLEAAHAPLRIDGGSPDDFWRGFEEGRAYRAALMDFLALCAKGDIGKVILHVADQPAAPSPSAEGLRSFRALEEFAEERGIRLCYENCKHPLHLAAVLKEAGPFHGFCYDSGHHYCYTPQERYLEQYRHRLLYTHLHDNLGEGRDLHLLPGDGSIDWRSLCAALKGYEGSLNLELSCAHREAYRAMRFEKFAALALQRAKALEEQK